MNETQSSVAAGEAEAGRLQRRWPAALVFLTAGFAPAATARRTEHVSIARSYAIHIIALLLAISMVIYLIAAASRPYSTSPAEKLNRFAEILGLIREAAESNPRRTVLIILTATITIQLGVLLQALILMPWGARDEPLQRSFRHALRRVLLQTAHLPLAVFLAGSCAVQLVYTEQKWEAMYPVPPPTAPDRPSPVPTTGPPAVEDERLRKQWDEYRMNLADWRIQKRRAKPILLQQEQEIGIFNIIFVAVSWVILALLRAVGTRGSVEPIARPPTCEACGYNLTMMPSEGRCPECGEPVAASLGPLARTGAPWEHRQLIGRLRTWWTTAFLAAYLPQRLGRELCVREPTTEHRLFLALHLPLFFLIGAAGIFILFVIDTGRSPASEPDFALVGVPAMGLASLFGTVHLSLFHAALVGIVMSLRAKRNLLPASMQAAAYLMPYLAAWFLLSAVVGLTMIEFHRAGFFEPMLRMSGRRLSAALFLIWLVPNVLLGARYLLCLWRCTAAARYANR